MKGSRTILVAAAGALLIFFQNEAVAQFVAADPGWVATGYFLLTAFLRLITTTPVFQKMPDGEKTGGIKALAAGLVLLTAAGPLSACGHFERPETPREKYVAASQVFSETVKMMTAALEQGLLSRAQAATAVHWIVAGNETLDLWELAVLDGDFARIDQWQREVSEALAELEKLYREVKNGSE